MDQLMNVRFFKISQNVTPRYSFRRAFRPLSSVWVFRIYQNSRYRKTYRSGTRPISVKSSGLSHIWYISPKAPDNHHFTHQQQSLTEVPPGASKQICLFVDFRTEVRTIISQEQKQ
ncbi:hypothetical protein ILYODFUR_020718 [Ilyodon furcidens]|uniref:Uncharacterized protein n=1 Tax=Ilyodon furcidens TaxID=33524 RepID=A0ABV0SMY4_9TELE